MNLKPRPFLFLGKSQDSCGSGNAIPVGMNWVGIMGCNVTAVTPCAMHANTFVAQNIFAATFGTYVGLAPGTMYIDAAAPTAFLGKIVYIR